MSVAVLLVVLGALSVWILVRASRDIPIQPAPPAPAFHQVQGEQEQKAIAEAMKQFEGFGKDKSLPAPGMAGELKSVFDGLGDAVRTRNQEQMLAHFNFERLVDELRSLEVLPPLKFRDRASFILGLRTGFGRTLLQQAPELEWTSFEIKSIKEQPPDEAVVIVRHSQAGGGILKLRWWVSKRQGVWRIFDMENLDVGLQLSVNMASLAENAGLDFNKGAAQAITSLREAVLAIALAEDPDAAEKHLRQMGGLKLPKKLEAIRLLVTGLIRIHREQHDSALEALTKAHECQPDMPYVDLLKGIVLNHLGQWDKALKHLEAYRDLLGEDANTCKHLGIALQGAERFKEACAAYRKSLDFNPKDKDAFVGLWRSLAHGEKKHDLGRRFSQLENPQESFDELAEERREAQDGEALEQLALAMRKMNPEHAGADYYLALAKAWTQKAAEALPLLKSAMAKQKDAAKRQKYAAEFVQAMAAANDAFASQALEIYAAMPAPEKVPAFAALARELVARKKNQELDQLLNEHAKSHPSDPWQPFYVGEWHLLRQEFEKAEQRFAAALALAPAEAQALVRSGLFRARVKLKKGPQSYRQFGPNAKIFEELANLCFTEKDAKQLDDLLAAHRKSQPDKSDLPFWDLDVKWLGHDYAGALRLAREIRQRHPVHPRFQGKLESYLVRCLVKLERAAEAIKEAEKIAKDKRGDKVLLILACAAHGDLKRTLAEMEKLPPQEDFLRACYQDADLGPILRRDAFREFRQRFPEPKEENGLPD